MKMKTCLLALVALTLLVPTFSVAADPLSHDLAVTRLDAPTYVQVGVAANVKATVTNVGSYIEQNVEVRFIVNGSLKQSKVVAALKNGSNVEMSFLWTPPSAARFNLTVFAVPVPGETNTNDNSRYIIVSASIWMPWKQVGYGYKLAMATDGNGHLYIAYHQYGAGYDYGYQIIVRRSTDGGYSWSDFGKWSHAGYRIGNPSIAIDPYDNKIYVVYELEITASNHDIYLKMYTPSLGWTESRPLVSGSGNDRYPSITSEYQYGSGNKQYMTYEWVYTSDDRNLIFGKSTTHGATWSFVDLHGSHSYDWWYVFTQVKITNAQGSIYIAYRVATDYYSTDGDIRVDISRDFGATWTTYYVDGVGPGEGDCSWSSIAATRGGDLVLVAFVYRNKVRYSYSQDEGRDPWQRGLLLDSLTKWQSIPQLAVDGEGRTSDSPTGYVHVVYKAYTPTTNIPLLVYRKVSLSEPTIWSARQYIVWNTTVYSAAITTQYRSRGNNFYPCVAFVRYLYPYYKVEYSTVAPLPFNYGLSVSPALVEVEAGGWTTLQVKATLLSGPTRPVTLKLYDLPSGVALTYFTSNYLAPSFTTTLLVCVYSDAPPGKYNLTIVGNGYEARSTTFTLNVKPKPSPTQGTTSLSASFEHEESSVITSTLTRYLHKEQR